MEKTAILIRVPLFYDRQALHSVYGSQNKKNVNRKPIPWGNDNRKPETLF